VYTGPGVFAPRPGARARTVWVAVLLSVVVVSLLGSAAPGFAEDPAGGRRGGTDRRTDLVGEDHEKLDRVQPGRAGGDAPASPAAAPVPDAPAPAQIDAALPPVGKDAGGERRAASPGSVAERSFTALLLLIAAVLVFLAVHGRVDRRDPKLGDRPGDFRRFR